MIAAFRTDREVLLDFFAIDDLFAVVAFDPETFGDGRLVDRFERFFVFVTLRVQREVNHHNRILLYDADEQNDSDQRDDAEIAAADQKGKNRSNAGRG